MKNPLRHIIAFIVCVLLFVCTALCALWIIILGSFVYLLPVKSWRRAGIHFLCKTPTVWTDINRAILLLSMGRCLKVRGDHSALKKKGWYLMVSNHQTWMDILMLSIAFNHKIPSLKFFMKKQLLWSLPFAGLACKYLGYPFMERYTRTEIRKNPKLKGKDIETTKQACAKVREHPTTLINFAEGTRFTVEKQRRQESPFQHLLKPKAGGSAVVIGELHDKLDGIVNVTINYRTRDKSMWALLCGRCRRVDVLYELLPITPELIGDYYKDRQFRASIQQWLNDLWEKKDQQLHEMKS